MNGGVATEALILASIVVPLVALAIVCWIFWRAAQRDKRGE
jgi:uncharacterized paraquat-inducible protein A